MMGKHRCLRTTPTPHPDGQPFAYCATCFSVVVRFIDQWWHLNQEAPTPKGRGKQEAEHG